MVEDFFFALLYLLGLVFLSTSYGSADPIIISILLLLFICFLIRISLRNRSISRSTLQVYCVLTFWSGIASLYGIDTHGPDAIYMYNIATNESLAIKEILAIENGASLAFFKIVYSVFLFFGVQGEYYIGSLVNIALMTFGYIVGYKILSYIKPPTCKNIVFFRNIYITSGMVFLFSSMHLRGALIQLSIELLVLLWVSVLSKINIRRVVVATLLTLSTVIYFKMLRAEFFYLPIIFIVTAYFVLLSSRVPIRIKVFAAVSIFFAVLFLLNNNAVYYFFSSLSHASDGYSYGAELEEKGVSLGKALVVDSHTYLRVFIGFVYLFISPFPFFSGMFSGSAYHLFKALHAFQMVLLIPYFYITLMAIVKTKAFKNPQILFIILIFIGFSASVALTSLETRHHGLFLILMFVLISYVYPKISEYRKYLVVYLLFYLILVAFYTILKTFL